MTVTVNGSPPTLAERIEFAQAMGLPVLLQSVTVATAQQDIDFTGLDLDADVSYRIELVVKPNSTGLQSVTMYYNADLTDANYQIQYEQAVNTTINGARAASPVAAFGGVAATLGQTTRSTVEISKISGAVPVFDSSSAYTETGNVMFIRVAGKWNSTANVTSIKLRHTSNFGVGTVARLFKEPK